MIIIIVVSVAGNYKNRIVVVKRDDVNDPWTSWNRPDSINRWVAISNNNNNNNNNNINTNDYDNNNNNKPIGSSEAHNVKESFNAWLQKYCATTTLSKVNMQHNHA